MLAVGGLTLKSSLSRGASLPRRAGALSRASVCLSIVFSDTRVRMSSVSTTVSNTHFAGITVKHPPHLLFQFNVGGQGKSVCV